VGQATQTKDTSTRRTRGRLLPGLAVKDGLVRHPFDLEFGVRTSGLVAGRHLAFGHRHDRHATAYYAVAPSVFRSMIVRWRRAVPRPAIDEFTFIDVGAGMGRAMLLAAELPFRAVIGVELHPTLARIARRNLRAWRAQGRPQASTRLYCKDAAAFKLPPGPCVAFLFNPFAAPLMRAMLRSFSRNLREDPRPFDLLYVNNEQDDVIVRTPGFKRLFRGQVRRSHADSTTDRRILTSQPGAEYAALDWEDCSIYRWVGTAIRS
jgi:SAM-dependent methyltransferase